MRKTHLFAAQVTACPLCREEFINGEHKSGNCMLLCCCAVVCGRCRATRCVPRCPFCGGVEPDAVAEKLAMLREHVQSDVPEALHALGEAYSRGHLSGNRGLQWHFNV